MTQIVESFAEISSSYDAAFVDLWGCMHNGLTAYPAAVAAMQAYRARGGKVILVTNSPRPRASVAEQIKGFGIPEDAYDAIATSGDAARTALYEGVVGQKVWFIGQEHERSFLQPPRILANPITIEDVSETEAEGIVCAGPFDPLADPNLYRPAFERMIAKGAKFLCANPDLIVDRGETRQWCAGELARIYTEMGGESLYFGKPHAAIYHLARIRLEKLGVDLASQRILCIGDGPGTDILGAADEGYDSLFITGGLAARETATQEQPEAAALEAYLQSIGSAPTYSIGFLR